MSQMKATVHGSLRGGTAQMHQPGAFLHVAAGSPSPTLPKAQPWDEECTAKASAHGVSC